jgi:hypothetical protein
VLHPAEREFGDKDDVVLWPRELVVEILFEIFDALACEFEDLRSVGLELGSLRFAYVEMGRERLVSRGRNPTGREGVLW